MGEPAKEGGRNVAIWVSLVFLLFWWRRTLWHSYVLAGKHKLYFQLYTVQLKCANLSNCRKPRFIEGHCCPICDNEPSEGLVSISFGSDSEAEWTMKCSDVGLVMGEVWVPGLVDPSSTDEWGCKVCGCMGKCFEPFFSSKKV